MLVSSKAYRNDLSSEPHKMTPVIGPWGKDRADVAT